MPVLLAIYECSKYAKLSETLVAACEALGLKGHYQGAMCAPSRLTPGVQASRSGKCLGKSVGENIHFPIEADSPANKPVTAASMKKVGRISVAVDVMLSAREAPAEGSAFERELDAMETASGGAKMCILVPKGAEGDGDNSGGDDDGGGGNASVTSPVTSTTHHALWLHSAYKDIHTRVRGHCLWGTGECAEVKRRLDKGNTDSGNLKIDIFGAELSALGRVRDVGLKACTALAIVRAMADDNYWMHDNEAPEAVAKLVEKIGEVWRNTLLKEDDGALGLGYWSQGGGAAGGGDDGGLHGGAASRAALFRLFELLAPRLEQKAEWGEASGCRFSWVLRKRRSNAEVAEEKAAKQAAKTEKQAAKQAAAAGKAAAKASKDAAKDAVKAAKAAAKAAPKARAGSSLGSSATTAVDAL